MERKVFLSIVSPIATFIGLIALFYPSVLLESKGVSVEEPVKVWMSEVGILLISVGVILFLVKNEEVSIALKAIFLGNIITQLGLFIIEILAYRNAVITEVYGVIPNSILHIILSITFLYYLIKMYAEEKQIEVH